MLKKVANVFLLTLSFLLNACSKESGRQVSQFEMRGIRDVVLDSSDNHVLPIQFYQTSGTAKPVDIDVFGLPSAISVAISKKNGLPDFGCELNFFQGGPPGVYRIKVAASSENCYREDSLLLFAPGNDFAVTGTRDVLINSGPYIDTMLVTVAYVSGFREKVEIGASAGIEGLWSYAQPSSGKPPFTSKISFFRVSAPSVAKPGIYPIKVVARNSSYTKSYDANLTIP